MQAYTMRRLAALTPRGGGCPSKPAALTSSADGASARRASALLLALLAALALSLALTAPAFADDVTGTIYETADGAITDNTTAPISIAYTISDETNEVTITSVVANVAAPDWADVVIPETIEGKNVTVIGDSAIYGMSRNSAPQNRRIKSIAFPKYVKTLEARACNFLTNLSSVSFAADSQLESIGDGAFSASAITSINLPDTVKHIGKSAFYSCRSLESFTFPAGYSDTKLSDSMFRDCGSLGVVTIPACVQEVGTWAFYEGELTVNGKEYHGPAAVRVMNPATTFASNAFQNANSNLVVYGWKLSDGQSTAETLAASQAGYTFVPLPVLNDYELTYQVGEESVSKTMPATVDVVVFGSNVPADGTQIEPIVRATVTDSKGATQLVSLASDDSGSCTLSYVDNEYHEGQAWAGKVKLTGKPASFTYGEVTYDILLLAAGITPDGSLFEYQFSSEGDTNTASVTGISELGRTATELTIPATIEYDNKTYSVTSIREGAFKDSALSASSIGLPSGIQAIGATAFKGTNISNITIPASVTSIGFEAFANCEQLATIAFDADSTFDIGTMFSGMTSLSALTLPGKTTEIGPAALKGCTSLTSLAVPDAVTKIGAGAFEGCCELASVTFGQASELAVIENGAFVGCEKLETLSIPKGVNNIGGSAKGGYASTALYPIPNLVFDSENTLELGNIFAKASAGGADANTLKTIVLPGKMVGTDFSLAYNSGLTSVELPSTMTTLGAGAFLGCSSLTSIELPDGLTSISKSLLNGCSALASITIPSTVTSIGASAFNGCTSLASIKIPSSVKTIDKSAFASCSSLASVELPDGLTSISNSLLSGCSALTGVTIPSTVTSIGASAFNGCTSLANVTIPSSVNTIGNNVFKGCASLESVELPEGLTTIGTYFLANTAVSEVNIPSTVKSIGGYAFDNSKVSSLTVLNPTTTFGTITFAEDAKVYGWPGSSAEICATSSKKTFVPFKVLGSYSVNDTAVSASYDVAVPETVALQEGGVPVTDLGIAVTAKEAYASSGLPALAAGTDYTVSVRDSSGAEVTTLVDAGTCTVTVSGVADKQVYGTYQGTVTVGAAEPAKIDLKDAVVTAEDATLGEGAAAATTKVTVKVGEATLEEGKDYELSYEGNDKPGTATVTATGKGNYTGTATATFKVTAAEPSNPDNPDNPDNPGTPDTPGTPDGPASSLPEMPSGAEKIAGDTRYGTAAAIALRAFPDGADAVVVANGASFADALAASSLAGALDAPIVTVERDSVPAEAASAIKELGAKGAYVVGGTAAVSDAAKGQVEALVGAEATRVWGADRYATAQAIYEQGKGEWGDTAIVAYGLNFADAVSVSPYANAAKAPIFLTDGSSLSADAQNALKSFERVVIVGGTAVVSTAVESQARASVGASGSVERLAGDDRYGTAAEIASWLVANAGFAYDGVAVATGTQSKGGADALAGGVLQGRLRSVMLLVDTDSVPDAAAKALSSMRGKVAGLTYLGGEAAVSQAVRDQVNAALGLDAKAAASALAAASVSL